MANNTILTAIVCYAILQLAYFEVSASCKGCSTYLEFSVSSQVKNQTAKFHMLVITDRKINCKLDFGDSGDTNIGFPPGLTEENRPHYYKNDGVYTVFLQCPNVMKSLLVSVESNNSLSKLTAKYKYENSTIEITLNPKQDDIQNDTLNSFQCPTIIDCDVYDIYFGKWENVSVNMDGLRRGFSLKVTKPGFHKIGVRCPCPKILYVVETVQVRDPCFRKNLFRDFPRTAERKPFEFYEHSQLLINEVQTPVLCQMNVTRRVWEITRKIGTSYKRVTWSFSDQAAFPEDAPFGLYRIGLKVISEKRAHSDTLYLLYKKIIRPLRIIGGSIQYIDSSRIVRLLEDEKRNGVYYLWCYKIYDGDTHKPLFEISLGKTLKCEPFTKSNSFKLPAGHTGKNRLVQVFGIMDTYFREGRSLLRPLTDQKNPVAVKLSCVYNCDGQVSANNNWVLKLELANTSSLDVALIRYEWTLYNYKKKRFTKFEKEGHWIEGADTSALTINGGSLRPKTWFRVCAKFSYKTNNASFKRAVCNEAFCGSPPSKGKCSLSSFNGIAMETQFTINCIDYVDDGIQVFRRKKSKFPSAGIRYAVLFKSDDNVALIYYGIFGKIGPFNLGAGDKNGSKAILFVRIYDIYYSFVNIEFKITVNMPGAMSQPIGDIEKYLLNRMSNIDQFPRQTQFNIMNSVSGVINKMSTKTLMEHIEYDVNNMVHGKFIDFDLEKNVFRTWKDMMFLMKNEKHRNNVRVYSNIMMNFVERIDDLSRNNDDAISILSTLGTLNLAVSYHPYVSLYAMSKTVEISRNLLGRSVQLCKEPIISVFINDIVDGSEILLGRLMSVINTNQIILAKKGFAWDTVRKYMENNQGYVKSEMIETAKRKSEIDEFERFYILQKTYLRSNIEIDQKRQLAKGLSSNLVDSHFDYQEKLFFTISSTGRNTKSGTGTSVCTKKANAVDGIGCGKLNLHIDEKRSSPSDNVTDIRAWTTKENVYTYDKDRRSSLVSQPTMILKLESKSKSTRSFVVKFQDSSAKTNPQTPKFIVGDQARLFYHRFMYRSKKDYACIRLTPEKNISLDVPGYEAYFRLQHPPNNDTFHYRTAFTPQNATVSLNIYQFCISPGVFNNNGSLYVGLRPFVPAGYDPLSIDLLSRYSFEAISIDCIVWNGTEWTGNTCRPLWTNQIACECSSNKQVTVTNTFFVAPNVIDFSTVFTKFDIINNGTVFAVVLGTFLLFIIIFAIAFRQDRKEEQKGHFCSLSDNYNEDSFYYLLIVYTGLKIGAGTQSNICFILSGECATSGVRALSDEAHKGFKSGSMRKFLMCTPSDLGDLIYLRIWTDGSGNGQESSWFLDRIEVMDIRTDKMFVFRCNAWLTTDENGRPVYLLPCNNFQDDLDFSSRLKENIHKSMTDGHLWFSAYMRPCYDQFTRAQRVTCCALVLYLTMIANAMFYRSGENILKPNQFTIGPLRFSVSQIAISLQSIAITLPPTFLVLTFFKNSKPPKYGGLGKDLHGNSLCDPSGYTGNGFLPHWCVYIGWLLAFLAMLASGFFVILFSIQWGITKSEEWMTTFLLSSGQSLLLVDPMKIFLVAFMIAILENRKRDFKLTYFDNISILQEIFNILYNEKDKPAEFSVFPPMGRQESQRRRRQVENEIWMRSISLNFIMYALLLWSSASIAYTNRNQNAFLFKDHLKKTFVDPPGSTSKFSEIKSVSSFYKWTRNIVYPAFFPTKDFKGNRLFWIDKKFINDGINIKVGPMLLRQLRIKQPEICSAYSFTGISDCYPAYSFSREEKSPHCLRWDKRSFYGFPSCGYEMVYNETLVAWSYTPASRINGLPTIGIYNTYSGGGYIMNIQVNDDIANKTQEELIRTLWIDRKTRAVFLEFTLYNANSNQFSNVFFLVEFPEIGGAIPYYQINVITAYNSFDPYTVVCMVIFCLCLVMFVVKNAYNLLKERKRFFKNFWNLVDLCALLSTSSASVAYLMQYVGTKAVLEQYREDPRKFLNFYHLVVWNFIITYNLAFQIFFTIIRLSCILGISQKISEIAAVMKSCVFKLFGVFYIFLIYTVAYTMVGNLAFTTLYPYRSYGASLTSILLLLLGKNHCVELIKAWPILGRIYFVSKIFLIIFIVLNMFNSVLSDGISSKRKTKAQASFLELFMRRLKISRMKKRSTTSCYQAKETPTEI